MNHSPLSFAEKDRGFFIACITKLVIIRRQIVSRADGANPHEMGVFSNPANKAA